MQCSNACLLSSGGSGHLSSVQFIHTYSHNVYNKNRKEKRKVENKEKSNLHVD